MKAAIYHRVSTTDQNPETTHDTLIQAAKKRGYEIVLDIRETGSGARQDRPGLQKLLHAANTRQIDAVFVWALDRFGRSTLDLLDNIETLNKHGVTFYATQQNLECSANSSATSSLLLTILAGVAEFERQMIRDRTRQGMKHAKKFGTRTGNPIGRPKTQINKAEIRRLKAAGLGNRKIASQLGYSRSTVQRALKAAK